MVNYSPEFKLGDDGPKTGEGTGLELAIAATVAHAIAATYDESVRDFFVAGHKHEGMTKGSVSVAWEGFVYDWAIDWPRPSRPRPAPRS